MWEIFVHCASDPFPGLSNSEAIGLITGKKSPMEPPPGSPPAAKDVMDLCFIRVRAKQMDKNLCFQKNDRVETLNSGS